jgi:hypothetical protein
MAEVYTGRFAPSPTGLLHPGSLVAALASWLDARAHGGQWLVRIEDVDTPAACPGPTRAILQQLAACGLVPDGPVLWQSQRGDAYAAALQNLVDKGWAYPCGCSRKEIESAQAVARHSAAVYPGTCREGLKQGKPARAWRLNVQAVQTALGCLPSRAGTTAVWDHNNKTCAKKWATLCCAAPMACGPTNWRWWWTTPHKASPMWCAAKTWPTTPRGKSFCKPLWAAHPALPAHAPGAGREWRKAQQTKRGAGAGFANAAGCVVRR